MGETYVEGLEAHLFRRTYSAALFYKADTKATITLAGGAHNRIVLQPQVGMLVYYYRSPNGGSMSANTHMLVTHKHTVERTCAATYHATTHTQCGMVLVGGRWELL